MAISKRSRAAFNLRTTGGIGQVGRGRTQRSDCSNRDIDPTSKFMNPQYAAISERANHRCEYCQAPEVVFNFPFEVEHIFPIARQGATHEANLALACRSCNLRKGIRTTGTKPSSDVEVRFFHPRVDRWSEHFQIDVETGKVIGATVIGEITVDCLEMNSPAQVAARQLWIRLGDSLGIVSITIRLLTHLN